MELNDFNKAELHEIAEEFGVEVETDDKKPALVGKIKDDGVNAELALKQIPHLKKLYAANLEEESAPNNVVSSEQVTALPPQDEIIVSDPNPVPQAAEIYLVKMDRENPYFEIGRYTWTQDHPYALVDSKDISVVLSERGMRVATPDELKDYYDG